MPNEFDTPQSRVEAILQNMLGAENELPPPKSRIEYYLQKILEEGGNSTTFKVFNPDWVTDSTTAAFCDSVNSDPEAVAGMAYLGELTCSDLPFNGNADAVVEIIDGTGTSGKVIHIVITSGNIAPYRWEYTYWNNGTDVSGWIAYATTDTVKANPTLAGTEPDLTGLEVNGVKYKAGGGSTPLYLHTLYILYDGTHNASLIILSSSASPFSSVTDIFNWLKNNGYTSGNSQSYQWASPIRSHYDNSNNSSSVIWSYYAETTTNNVICINWKTSSSGNFATSWALDYSNISISDNVVQIL